MWFNRIFYRGLVQDECDDTLKQSLGFGDNQLANLFERTFKPKSLITSKKSLALQCYRGDLPIGDKFTRHSGPGLSTRTRWEQDRETGLHAIVQCSGILVVWVYAEPLLSSTGRVQLSSVYIIKIDPSAFLSKEAKICFLVLARGMVSKTSLKRLKTGRLIPDSALVIFSPFNIKEESIDGKKMPISDNFQQSIE